MVDILKSSIGWITIIYEDGSKRIFRTTLNEEYLKELGVTDLGECLYDIDRKVLVELTGNISVSKEKPILDEFNAYINRYL